MSCPDPWPILFIKKIPSLSLPNLQQRIHGFSSPHRYISFFAFTQTGFTCDPLESGIAVKHLQCCSYQQSSLISSVVTAMVFTQNSFTLNLTQLTCVSQNIVKGTSHTSLVTVNQYPFALVIPYKRYLHGQHRIGRHDKFSISFA